MITGVEIEYGYFQEPDNAPVKMEETKLNIKKGIGELLSKGEGWDDITDGDLTMFNNERKEATFVWSDQGVVFLLGQKAFEERHAKHFAVFDVVKGYLPLNAVSITVNGVILADTERVDGRKYISIPDEFSE